MPGGTPQQIDACRAQRVSGDPMVRTFPQLESDMVDARFWSVDDVDGVVVPIAGKEVRNPSDVVGEPEAEKVLEERHELAGFRGDHRHMSEAQRRCASLLEPGRGSFHRAVKLDDVTAGRLDLSQLLYTERATALDRHGKAKRARITDEIGDRDVGL